MSDDIQIYCCQLCGKKSHIIPVMEPDKIITQENSDKNEPPKDYEREILTFKEHLIKERNQAISDFWDCVSIWDGYEKVDWLNSKSIEAFIIKVLIRSVDLGEEDASLNIGTTVIEHLQQEVPRGPLGFFGKEFREIENRHQIHWVESTYWLAPRWIEQTSGHALSARIDFKEDLTTSRKWLSGREIEDLGQEFVEADRFHKDKRYCISPVTVVLNIKFAPEAADRIQNIYRLTWPRLRHLRCKLEKEIEDLKGSSLVHYIASASSPYDQYDERKLKPREQRASLVLGADSYCGAGGCRYSDCVDDTYRNDKFNSFTDEQLMALAFALEDTSTFYIPFKDYSSHIQYKSGSVNETFILKQCYDRISGLLLFDASHRFPERNQSLFEALTAKNAEKRKARELGS